ncbi:MAG: hypothetical protein JXM72_03105 [Deltaproteobacteria bacterium]|nr:hypothetical protein [Deltaproteobacteria bacterium]
MAKMTRKDLLNAPDEFVTTTSTIVKWTKENPLRLAAITTIVVVLITSGIGFYYWKTNRESTAMLAYTAAYNNSQMTLQVIDDYPDTKAGKLSRLRLAGQAYGQNEYTMALNHSQEFISSWGHEDIFYWEGILIMSASYLGLDTMDKAIPLLEECIANSSGNIRDQALFYKAQALIGLNKNDEAMQSLMKISDAYQDIAKISLAQLEQSPGEITDAE